MSAQSINRHYFLIKNHSWHWGVFYVCKAIFIGMLSLAFLNSFASQDSEIEDLHLYLKPDGLYLDVKMQLELSPEAVNALEKGIVLHFVAKVEVKRERWYWFDATDAQKQKLIKLSYQPLLRKYRVAIGGFGQTLNSLAEALNVIGAISQWHILDRQNLNTSARSRLLFSFDLDRSQLPGPFQYGIRHNQDWDLHLHKQIDLPIKLSGVASE